MSADLRTSSLHKMLGQIRDGDRSALNELIQRTQTQLEHLARKMLRDFPGVRSREQTEDVLQNSLLRLAHALQEVTPASVREFYRLASTIIRRELVDLARRHASRPADALGERNPCQPECRDLVHWATFQEAVESLPTDQREVFGLTFYQGWTQSQIAELLLISDRQVRRLWSSACLNLNRIVAGKLPKN